MSETDEDAEWDAEYERKRRLLCEIFGDDPDAPQPPERPSNTVPLFPLAKIWPDFGGKLEDLLTRKGEHLLASTIDDLWVYDRCTCGAAYCATVYTQPRPERGYGPTHRNVSFWPPNMVNLDTQRTVVEEHPGAVMAEHLTVLDVVDDRIACIEVMYAQDLHDRRDEKIAARIAKDRAAWRNEGV